MFVFGYIVIWVRVRSKIFCDNNVINFVMSVRKEKEYSN
jgi:hypothetical protein